MRVCLVTDLHLSPPLTQATNALLLQMQLALQSCGLVVYLGDILTIPGGEARGPSGCDSFYNLARLVVEQVGRPYMFTLGNHDGEVDGAARLRLRQTLNASTFHAGHCDASLDACIHPSVGVATLYSGKTACHADTYYGCPSPATAGWIDSALGVKPLGLLVTHIPPPSVLGLQVNGAVGENVCCWDAFEFDDAVLPSVRPTFHAFGHDHSNLFVSEEARGVRYVATYKSGLAPNSYDANFYRGSSGYTVIEVSEMSTATGQASHAGSYTFAGEDVARFYEQTSLAVVSQARCCPNTAPLPSWRVPPPPSPSPPPLPPPCPLPNPVPSTCTVPSAELHECSCRYVWEAGYSEPTGTTLLCGESRLDS